MGLSKKVSAFLSALVIAQATCEQMRFEMKRAPALAIVPRYPINFRKSGVAAAKRAARQRRSQRK